MPTPPDSPAPRRIRIAAALVVGSGGRILLVRKRGTTAFMQPGGKIDPGETPLDALRRELHEELGLVVPPSAPHYLGHYTAPAANEPDALVDAELFRIAVVQQVQAANEIAEVRWVDPTAPGDLELAPLTRDHVLPISRSVVAP